MIHVVIGVNGVKKRKKIITVLSRSSQYALESQSHTISGQMVHELDQNIQKS